VEEFLTESAEIPRGGRLVTGVLRDRRSDRCCADKFLTTKQNPGEG
jgi:hypothetical protein